MVKDFKGDVLVRLLRARRSYIFCRTSDMTDTEHSIDIYNTHSQKRIGTIGICRNARLHIEGESVTLCHIL